MPKRDSSKSRVVDDLSFPEGVSVNSGIPEDSYLNHEHKLVLLGVDRLIHFIRLHGRHCHIYKKDRTLPGPSDKYHWILRMFLCLVLLLTINFI